MAATRRFAEDTRVPVQQTRNEIEILLKKRGATRFFYADGDGDAVVGFYLRDRLIRITLPLAMPRPGRVTTADQRKVDQDTRRRWRSLLLIIKAKLEAVDGGISTLEREFMPDVVMPDGQTVADWIQPQLSDAYSSGRMPPLLTYRGD